MADFDPLDPSVACHPILPANVPIDRVRYSTILPIEVNVDGSPKTAEIPAGYVMPTLFENVSTSSEKHLQSLNSAASTSSTVVPAWKKLDLRTEKRAPPSLRSHVRSCCPSLVECVGAVFIFPNMCRCERQSGVPIQCVAGHGITSARKIISVPPLLRLAFT